MNPSNDDTEGLGADQGEIAGADLIDVRRTAAFAQSAQMLPGAQWRDPEAIMDWSRQLDPGREIVVYCVHGHEVSRGAAHQLCAQGFRARFLRGGIDGWQKAGLPLADKPGA